MKGFALGPSLSLAFILGCMSAPFLLARSSAQTTRPAPTRWEYKCDVITRLNSRMEFLQANGAQGWDVAAITDGLVCMKRPLR